MKVDRKLKIEQDGIFSSKRKISIPRRTVVYITKEGEVIITTLFKEFLKLAEELSLNRVKDEYF